MSAKRPTYVYRVVVTQWPDWCPEGWERVYSDIERFPPVGPDFEGDATPEVPEGLHALLCGPNLPGDFPAVEDDHGAWAYVACPKRSRDHWLSGSAAHRWVRHARFLGAEAHVERGCVNTWEER